MSKKAIVTSIILISIGIIGMLFMNRLNEQGGFNVQTKTFDARKIDAIYTQLYVSDIEVKQSKDAFIKVEWLDSIENPIEVNEKDRTIKVSGVKQKKKLVNLQWNEKERPVRLYLPAKKFKQLEFHTRVGQIKGENIFAEKALITTSTGDVQFKKGEIDNLDIKVQVGDITLEKIKGNGQFETKTGNIKYKETSIKHPLSFRTKVGNIHISLEEKPKNVSFITQTEVGDIQVFEKKESIHVDGGISVYAKTATGDIKIINER
ncbi:MAG TPA: DUF4097 family beta strand repeat-containing protein [Massilibacterium sp.]|nr:DUF4097 family beta strand repeat-containing protein [Massilibacterium sp.]